MSNSNIEYKDISEEKIVLEDKSDSDIKLKNSKISKKVKKQEKPSWEDISEEDIIFSVKTMTGDKLQQSHLIRKYTKDLLEKYAETHKLPYGSDKPFYDIILKSLKKSRIFTL